MADRASLDLFAHLALEIADTAMREPVPVMLAATYRQADDPRLETELERLAREEICRPLALQALAASESGEMVRSLGLAASTRQLEDTVYRVAGGNPLFIENIVHQLARTDDEHRGPNTIADIETAAPREITRSGARRRPEESPVDDLSKCVEHRVVVDGDTA